MLEFLRPCNAIPRAMLLVGTFLSASVVAAAESPPPPEYSMQGDWDLTVVSTPINSKPPTISCAYHLQITQKSSEPFGYPPLKTSNPPPPAVSSAPVAPTTGVKIHFTGAYKSNDPGVVASLAYKDPPGGDLPACYHAAPTGSAPTGAVGVYGYNAVFEGFAFVVSYLGGNGFPIRVGEVMFSMVIPFDPKITNVQYTAGYARTFAGPFVKLNGFDPKSPSYAGYVTTIQGGWADPNNGPHNDLSIPGSFILKCISGPCQNFWSPNFYPPKN